MAEFKAKLDKSWLSKIADFIEETAHALGVQDPNVIYDLKLAVEKIGYKAHVGEENSEDVAELERKRYLAEVKHKLWVSVALTLPLFVLNNEWIALVLATPVQFWVGRQFYQSTWSGLKNRMANMDTLIGIGTTTAFSPNFLISSDSNESAKMSLIGVKYCLTYFCETLNKVLSARSKIVSSSEFSSKPSSVIVAAAVTNRLKVAF